VGGIFLYGCATFFTVQQKERVRELRDKKIHAKQMDNGFWVYSRNDDVAHTGGFGARVGSIYDPLNARGTSHFYEHVTARRTRKLPGRELDIQFAKYLGGPDDDINIRTDLVSTFYGHGDLIRTDHMFKVLDIMADLLNDRLLDQEGLEVEMSAVYQEYFLNGRDLVDSELDQMVREALYERNPARNRIDCVPEELTRITLADLRQFGRRYYVPANMFMVMIGPKHERARAFARRHFGDLPKSSRPRLDYDRSEDQPKLSSTKLVERPWPGIHQVHTAVAWPTSPSGAGEGEVLDVLADTLRMRLSWRLREDNRVLDSGTYRNAVHTERTFVHGMLYATFATVNPEAAARAHDIVMEEVARLREELAPADEVDAHRSHLEYFWLDALRGNALNLSEFIIDAACNGDEDLSRLNTYQDRIRAVDRRKVREAARKYLTDEHVQAVIRPVP
jgi:zinc protease